MSGTCMRCPYGRERVGDHARYFTVGEDPEEVYSLELCGEHARRFDMDLNLWGSLANVVPLPAGAVRSPVSREFVGDGSAARIRELRERAARDRPVAVVDEDREEILLGSRAEQWRFSPHAQQRAKERGFTPEQVLTAAAYPETKMPSPSHADRRYHVTDPCCAVVDPKTKLIITVYTKFEYLCKSVNDARKTGKQESYSHART